jgi:hypothetical protein
MTGSSRWCGVMFFAALLAGGDGSLAAQSKTADRLTEAKTLKCEFALQATGDWKDGRVTADVKPATLAITFDNIDTDEGSATISGEFGPSEIIVKLSSGTLHFMQSFREGPLYATTVFGYESEPGRLRAVHTRHEYTPVSLPGFTSRPEQYYGACQIVR